MSEKKAKKTSIEYRFGKEQRLQQRTAVEQPTSGDMMRTSKALNANTTAVFRAEEIKAKGKELADLQLTLIPMLYPDAVLQPQDTTTIKSATIFLDTSDTVLDDVINGLSAMLHIKSQHTNQDGSDFMMGNSEKKVTKKDVLGEDGKALTTTNDEGKQVTVQDSLDVPIVLFNAREWAVSMTGNEKVGGKEITAAVQALKDKAKIKYYMEWKQKTGEGDKYRGYAGEHSLYNVDFEFEDEPDLDENGQQQYVIDPATGKELLKMKRVYTGDVKVELHPIFRAQIESNYNQEPVDYVKRMRNAYHFVKGNVRANIPAGLRQLAKRLIDTQSTYSNRDKVYHITNGKTPVNGEPNQHSLYYMISPGWINKRQWADLDTTIDEYADTLTIIGLLDAHWTEPAKSSKDTVHYFRVNKEWLVYDETRKTKSR